MYNNLPNMDEPLIPSQLLQLQNLIEGEKFLSALGRGKLHAARDHEFPVVDDLGLAAKMMTSQDIWGTPEPWPYQYFVGEIGDELSDIKYNKISGKRGQKVLEISIASADSRTSWQINQIQRVFEKNNVIAALTERYPDQDVVGIAGNIFINEIDAYLRAIFSTILLTGNLDNSRFFKRLFEAFETGDIPCGRAGGVTHRGGADPKTCMCIFY